MSGQTAPEVAKLIYGGINVPILSAIPIAARRILDVGCGDGSLGVAIKGRQPAEVIGLTYSEGEAERATGRLDRVLVGDLNSFDPTGLGTFDCVVCSHVLEHLYWPDNFLACARTLFGHCLAPLVSSVFSSGNLSAPGRS